MPNMTPTTSGMYSFFMALDYKLRNQMYTQLEFAGSVMDEIDTDFNYLLPIGCRLDGELIYTVNILHK